MESERIQLLKEIEGLKEEKVKKYEQRIKNQVEYSSDLKEQIAFQKEMKQLEQASNQLEIEMAKVRSIGCKFPNHVYHGYYYYYYYRRPRNSTRVYWDEKFPKWPGVTSPLDWKLHK